MTSPSPSVDPVRERIAEIQQRVNAATDGPWQQNGRNGVHQGYRCMALTEGDNRQANAEFIAAGRSDIPALVAALTAVLDRVGQLQQFGYGSASDYDKGGLRAANEIRAAIAAGLGVTP